MNSKIKLISVKLVEGKEKISSTDIYAKIKSVIANDFYNAGQSGHKPKFIFIVYKYEYKGQPSLEYENKIYSIFRTYEVKGEKIELHCEEKTGEKNKYR